MCFEGEKWAMNSDHSEIEGEKKKRKTFLKQKFVYDISFNGNAGISSCSLGYGNLGPEKKVLKESFSYFAFALIYSLCFTLLAPLYIFARDLFLCFKYLFGSRGIWASWHAQKGVSKGVHFSGHWPEPLCWSGRHNSTAVKQSRAGLCLCCTPTSPHTWSSNCVITWKTLSFYKSL